MSYCGINLDGVAVRCVLLCSTRSSVGCHLVSFHTNRSWVMPLLLMEFEYELSISIVFTAGIMCKVLAQSFNHCLFVCLKLCWFAVTPHFMLLKLWKGQAVTFYKGRGSAWRKRKMLRCFLSVFVWRCLQHKTCTSINSSQGLQCVLQCDMIKEGF